MLLIPTRLCISPIHGYGCFSAVKVQAGSLVWVFNPKVDRVLPAIPLFWERLHAYGSNTRESILILPGDNGAWINFSDHYNLFEAEEINGEFCLRAAADIEAEAELTVSIDSDADAKWKIPEILKQSLKCTKDATSS